MGRISVKLPDSMHLDLNARLKRTSDGTITSFLTKCVKAYIAGELNMGVAVAKASKKEEALPGSDLSQEQKDCIDEMLKRGLPPEEEEAGPELTEEEKRRNLKCAGWTEPQIEAYFKEGKTPYDK